jgi:hypothetical protein
MTTVHTPHQEASSTMAESTPDTEETTSAQDFLVFLSGVNKGRTAKELGEKLQELVAAIQNTGKPGTLNLKITVKKAGKNGDALIVTDEVLVKAPKLSRPESIFFPDSEHNLVRNDPNQPSMF